MRFTKMHGLGNDYIYVDTQAEPVENPARLARIVSDRNFGIGGDGLILIDPPAPGEKVDAGMRIFNADGSEAEMCGNGIRCVARWLYDRGRVRREGGGGGTTVRIGTRAGLREVEITPAGARVGMGSPRLRPEEIPTRLGKGKDRVVLEPIEAGGEKFLATCVSVGNPHCVIVIEDIDAFEIARVGPEIENHPLFPARVNVEFVTILSPAHIRQRTWERGSGETLACGTGATAALVAAHLAGVADRRATVHLAGGDLEIVWDEEDRLWMTGPAQEVFAGEIDAEAVLAGFPPTRKP